MEVRNEQLEITVSEPYKIGDRMSAYVIYKVTTRTNLPYFKQETFSVARRFSEFLALHDRLVARHLHLGIIVPPAPEKSVFGMAKVKIAKDEAVLSDDFIEKRRAALERYVNRTASHPVLRRDSYFQDFLEKESSLPKAALSGAGVFDFFNSVSDTVNKMAFKMQELDPWFEEKQNQIEKVDKELRSLHAIIDTVVQHRKNISTSTASVTKSVKMMGICEENTPMTNLFLQLAEVEENMELLQIQQANDDFYLLSELVKDYIGLIAVVNEVLYERVKVYQAWKIEEEILAQKIAKVRLASNPEASLFIASFGGMSYFNAVPTKLEMMQWDEKVKLRVKAFETISKTVRNEIERFEQKTMQDFEKTMAKYVERLLEAHQEVIKYWEEFLPEAKDLAKV